MVKGEWGKWGGVSNAAGMRKKSEGKHSPRKRVRLELIVVCCEM